MTGFEGFSAKETFTQIPDSLFGLLRDIDDAGELKMVLDSLWRIEHVEGSFRAVCETDFDAETLGLSTAEMKRGLKKCVERGTLIKVTRDAAVFYFLNSPRGRTAADAFARGEWRASAQITSPRSRSNLFKSYEENIGPLTPMIADTLKDAEHTYPQEWIADAIDVAVKNNKRNWNYIDAILKRWKDQGRGKKQDGRNDKKLSQQSIDNKLEQLRKRSGQ